MPKIKPRKILSSFCKTKNKWYHAKVLLKRFHLEWSHHRIVLIQKINLELHKNKLHTTCLQKLFRFSKSKQIHNIIRYFKRLYMPNETL